jgi:glycosyltransferase involved in cell wall biosynthesis
MKVWAHTLVKNEERYVWYAVMSVIDWVDKILIWDTGSTDKTVEIIKEIKKVYPDKVDFKEVGEVDPQKFTKVRQKMLDATTSDWLILIDGDEVWWEDSIKAMISTVRTEGDTLETIVNSPYNIVGDIYHYQEEAAGRYEIDGRRGHFSFRAINRKIPGLHLKKPHGIQGFFDRNGALIQERPKKFRKFLDAPFMHFTYMARSSSREKDLKVPKRDIKLKYELGIPFPRDFYYPEVFFRSRPAIVPSPWRKIRKDYFLRAFMETPIRRLKRRMVKSDKIGY